MGSLGASNLLDEFGGALGDRNRVNFNAKVDELVNSTGYGYAAGSMINPFFLHASAYKTNCALCTTAVALNLRGYDVEALPRDTTWRGFDSVFDVDYTNPDNYVVGDSRYSWQGSPSRREAERILYSAMVPTSELNTMPRGAESAANKVVSMMKKWGPGSVAAMSVRWKNANSSHSVSVINQNGNVFIYDAQSGKKITDIQSYMKRTVAVRTSLTRLDNAPVKEDFKDLDKIVQRRKQRQ